MNPLKNLFNKVFEATPTEGAASAPKEESAFEWNPDEETVAATSARQTSWKRGEAAEGGPRRAAGDASHEAIAASAQSVPVPEFERPKPSQKAVQPEIVAPTPAAAVVAPPPAAVVEPWVRPSIPERAAVTETPGPETPASTMMSSPPQIPLSDFEDVYRKAGIKSPVHGYGVERVYRLLTSRRLVGLDRNVRRSALLTALDAAGVPASDVSQDAVLRRKALEAHEAEKALELQSLRSRNESRAEALQDTVETFTRQKQSQIERLAQGSTAAVRAQSDLEIRKRMEQDRLYRSLAYFVESLPVAGELKPVRSEAARVIERFDATMEMSPLPREEAAPPAAAPAAPAPPAAVPAADMPTVEAVTLIPPTAEEGAETRPLSQSGLELALRAAAEEARLKGFGQPALIEDKAADPEDAAQKLREAKKADSGS